MQVKDLLTNNPDLKILFEKSSIKFLKKIEKKKREQLIAKIDFVLKNPNSLIPLKGTPKRFKIRVGDIRILIVLTKEPKGIKISNINYRGNVYKK